jgi:hypothetical protein
MKYPRGTMPRVGEQEKSRSRVNSASTPCARQIAATRASWITDPRTRGRSNSPRSTGQNSSVSPIKRYEGESTHAWICSSACTGSLAACFQIRRLVTTLKNSYNTARGAPTSVALGQFADSLQSATVFPRLATMGVHQDVRIDGEHGVSKGLTQVRSSRRLPLHSKRTWPGGLAIASTAFPVQLPDDSALCGVRWPLKQRAAMSWR